ncbi:sporulation protein [Bacillus sp. HMF5848]|uniref:sporulation protein n=1 Tax=Bacillus sp. HMF5848 TaxID=2495421 RepID=UPI000F769E54|nr:sporulation protein [Bacillus sp. HMF5848]RSK26597.1 sporulation protein [Bacillus sp. HMF5848]
MLLRKYMSLIGIGSTEIDLILPKNTFKKGEEVKGYYLLKGGTIEQQLKRIECDLVLSDEVSGAEKVIESTTILTSITIHAEELHRIDFTFCIPRPIDLSSSTKVYSFKTKLAFTKGVESTDHDPIIIVE